MDIGADQLVVDHISLLFTVFRRVSGANVGRLLQVSNIVLNTLFIENVSRSKAMKEQLSLMISFDTSFEDIQALKTELIKFVSDKENSRDFQNDLEVEVLGTSDMVGIFSILSATNADERYRASSNSELRFATSQIGRMRPCGLRGAQNSCVLLCKRFAESRSMAQVVVVIHLEAQTMRLTVLPSLIPSLQRMPLMH